MQNIGNIIAQLTAAQTSVQPNSSAGASQQPSSGSDSGSSFQTALNNANTNNNSSQSNSSTGQVLPASNGSVNQTNQNSMDNSSENNVNSSGNSGNSGSSSFGRLSSMLGSILQQQPSSTASSANLDNLLINGNTSNSGQNNNIESPDALLAFLANQNALQTNAANQAQQNNSIADNTNVLDNLLITGAPSSETGQTTDSQQKEQQDSTSGGGSVDNAAQSSAALSLILAQAANSQVSNPINNNGNADNNTSIDPNSKSNALNNIVASNNQLQQAAQQNATVNNSGQNFSNLVAQAGSQAVLSNSDSSGQGKTNLKIISESKTPDFSNFSNQSFVVKSQVQPITQEQNTTNTYNADIANEDMQNEVAVTDADDQANTIAAKTEEKADADVNNISAAGAQAASNTSAADANKPVDPSLQNLSKYQQTPTDQVAFQVAAAVKDGNSKIRIQLEPADLGKIDVQMSMTSDGKLNLNIMADKNSTLNLLQNDSKTLEKTLNDIGFKSDATNLSFNLRNGGDNGGQPQPTWTFQNYGDNTTENPDAPDITAYSSMANLFTSNQALDMRV